MAIQATPESEVETIDHVHNSAWHDIDLVARESGQTRMDVSQFLTAFALLGGLNVDAIFGAIQRLGMCWCGLDEVAEQPRQLN